MRLCVRVALCVMLMNVMEIRFYSPGVCIISLLGILNLVFGPIVLNLGVGELVYVNIPYVNMCRHNRVGFIARH